MQENRIVCKVTFNYHVQSLVQETIPISDSTMEAKVYSSSDGSMKEKFALVKYAWQ